VDILLLGQLASTFALGLYNVAYKPTNMLVHFGSTVAVALFPLMAQAPQKGMPVAFERAMRGMGIAGPAVALALSGLAGALVQVLYGSEFAAAAPILVVLAWAAAENWLYAPLGFALQARGRERWWLASLAGGLLLNVAGNFWAIPRWGAVGAAVVTLVSEAALLALGSVLVGRLLGILPSLKPVVIILGATMMGSLTLWALQPGGIMLATVAALVVYGGILILFRVVTAEDVTIVLGWFRGGSEAKLEISGLKHRAPEQV
jgi:O-antigen/teichoic acid export membrane protein